MLVHKMGGVLPPVKQLVLETLEVRGLDAEVYDDLRMDIVVGGKTFSIISGGFSEWFQHNLKNW